MRRLLLALTMGLALMLVGGPAWSVDPDELYPLPESGDRVVPMTPEDAAFYESQGVRALNCEMHWSSDFANLPAGLGAHIQVGVEVYYGHCSGAGHGNHWVDPRIAVFKCRHSGGPNRVQKVHFNLRAWDYDAPQHIWNPTYKVNQCNAQAADEEWDEVQIASPAVQAMKRCAAGVPRWETNGKTFITGAADDTWRLAGTMWGYSGPTAVDC